MKIGFRIPYRPCDATSMCLQVAKLALDFGIDIEIYPLDKAEKTNSFWDRYLVRKGKYPVHEWLKSGLEQIFYCKPPDADELSYLKKLRVRSQLLLLWDMLEKTDESLLLKFDGIISPARAPARLFIDRLRPPNLQYLPWDTGIPFTIEAHPVEVDRLSIYWPLTDSQIMHQELQFLPVIAAVLKALPALWLTISCSSAMPLNALRELQKLVQCENGRVELLHDPVLEREQLLYGFHDLTIWPTLLESAALVGLSSLSMGTPLIAFDHPIVSEVVRDGKNGHLVPCELSLNELQVPRVVPDYPLFTRHLLSLLSDVSRIRRLREDTVSDLRERRQAFHGKWKAILCGIE